MTDIEIRPIADAPVEGMLSVINAAFPDRPKTIAWFEWKHRNGPWGPSRGYAAMRGDQVVGLRLLVPWLIRVGSSEVPILRAMDGAVHPEARRQGLFSLLVRTAMADLTRESDPARLLFSTSVPASRDAYLKIGFTAFTQSADAELVRPTPARVVRSEWPVLPEYAPAGDGTSGSFTQWTADALRWRCNPLSGHNYVGFSLREADSSNGVIIRLASVRGFRAAVVCHIWGPPALTPTLAGAAARQLRTPLLLSIPTASKGRIRRSLDPSTVSLWSPDQQLQARLASAAAWRFSLADLEGCM